MSFSLQQVLEQLQNDSDSVEEFASLILCMVCSYELFLIFHNCGQIQSAQIQRKTIPNTTQIQFVHKNLFEKKKRVVSAMNSTHKAKGVINIKAVVLEMLLS